MNAMEWIEKLGAENRALKADKLGLMDENAKLGAELDKLRRKISEMREGEKEQEMEIALLKARLYDELIGEE